MKTIDLEELRAAVQARKRFLGWDTPEWTEQLRNRGHGRLPEKREMLAHIRGRVQAAGVTPLEAFF